MTATRARALLVAAGAAAALVLPAGVATAAPGQDCPPAGNGGSYPGSSCTLQVSDSTVVPGESVTVSGSGFQSGTPYTITFRSTPQVLATGTANGSTITDTVTIPTDATQGSHTLTLDGTDTDGGARELVASITVVSGSSASGGGSASSGGTQTEGLAATGASSQLLPFEVGGAALLIAGGGLVIASRRRRRAEAPRA